MEREVHRLGRFCQPVFDRASGDDGHEGPGFASHATSAGEKAADAPLATVVGGSGEAEIAELAFEKAEIFGGADQRLGGVERIGEGSQRGGGRHELGDAHGAGGAHRLRIEAALLPDQAGKEALRQPVVGSGAGDRVANVGDIALLADADALGAELSAAGGGLFKRRLGPCRSRLIEECQSGQQDEQGTHGTRLCRDGQAVNRHRRTGHEDVMRKGRVPSLHADLQGWCPFRAPPNWPILPMLPGACWRHISPGP